MDELILSHGNERHTLKQGFGPGPTLTAFLNTHLNAGTLIVATTENNVRILVNGREYPSNRGLLRIQTVGPVSVRVSKNGFEDPPEQKAEVRKEFETHLQFKMKPRLMGNPPVPRLTDLAEVLSSEAEFS